LNLAKLELRSILLIVGEQGIRTVRETYVARNELPVELSFRLPKLSLFPENASNVFPMPGAHLTMNLQAFP
jgi:hypothetical protein